MSLNKDYLVEKKNILNEIKNTGMTVQELKLFSIYLAKINPRDASTKKVRFTVKHFQKLMELKRANIPQLKATARQLLSRHPITIDNPNGKGGFKMFQLFSICEVEQDEKSGTWYFEIEAHNESLPLMFDYKTEYFKYRLGNVLNLNSTNQIKMYELLKQYEFAGKRDFTLKQLRENLWIEENKHKRWDLFVTNVLKPCQQALLENTDICFTYEPIRNGRGGKVVGVFFIITGNDKYDNYVDQATKELLEAPPLDYKPKKGFWVEDTSSQASNQCNDYVNSDESPYNFSVDKDLYFQACKREFTESEMDLILEIVNQSPIFSPDQDRELSICEYLTKKHKELCYRDSKKPIKHRFAYFKKLLEVGKVKLELEKQLEELETGHKSRRNNYNLERRPSYDLEAYENDNVFLEKQLGKFENLA